MGKAAVALLEAHGFSVIVPPQRCCGIPRLGVGDLRGAREMGERNIALLLPTVREGTDIVFSSTSCGLMLRHEYGPLLNLPGAEELAARLFDICEFLSAPARGGKNGGAVQAAPPEGRLFRPLPPEGAQHRPPRPGAASGSSRGSTSA